MFWDDLGWSKYVNDARPSNHLIGKSVKIREVDYNFSAFKIYMKILLDIVNRVVLNAYDMRLLHVTQTTLLILIRVRSKIERYPMPILILAVILMSSPRLNAQEPRRRDHRAGSGLPAVEQPARDVRASSKVLALRPKIQSRLKRTNLKYMPAQVALTGETMPCSTGIVPQQVGTAPEGWSNGFEWCREQGQVLLAIFVNSASEPGIPISGLKAGDWLFVTGAARLSATFSKDKGNATALGITKVVATAADIAAVGLGQAELAPLISAGQSFAEAQFKGSGNGSKRRNVYGMDPASGTFHLQEGGVVVVLPGGDPSIAYSGDEDHTKKWLKKHEFRFDQNKPDHLASPNYFFPVPGQEYVMTNVRQVQSDGIAWILPWDFDFEDNVGSYALYVLVSQTKPNIPDVLHLQ
jgi:hypothetical protein